MPGSVKVTTGTNLWMHGEVWTVHEFVDGSVVLVSGDRVSRASIAQLAEHARPLDSPPADPHTDPVPVLLSSLPSSTLRELESRAAHMRQLCEPMGRNEVADRIAAKAAELGVSVKTIRRWRTAYQDGGIAGLVDARLRQPSRSAVHPLWDEACLAELRSHVEKSTPTKGAVIAATARRVEAEHGRGVVPLPSTATAYRRLDELARGKYAFGSAKARRSVANRPEACSVDCVRPDPVSTSSWIRHRWMCSRWNRSRCDGSGSS